MSFRKRPLMHLFSGSFVKMLSISEAVCDVIHIGRVIIGKNILENNSSKKSLVAW